jgi:hypothetical protein
MTFIDLFQEIYQGMPGYPEHLQTAVVEWRRHTQASEKLKGGSRSIVPNNVLLLHVGTPAW